MFEYDGYSIIPILIATSQLLKQQGLNSKLIPIVNLVMGVIFGVMLNWGNLFKGVVIGLVMALTSMGLYSGTKSSVELFK